MRIAVDGKLTNQMLSPGYGLIRAAAANKAREKEAKPRTAAEAMAIYNKRTQLANAKFNSMTPAKQRVAIAKDALRMLSLKAIIPRHGTYLNASFGDPEKFPLPEDEEKIEKMDIRKDFLPKMEQCAVCAIGLAALAKFNVANQAKFTDFGASYFTISRDSYTLNIKNKASRVLNSGGGVLYDHMSQYFSRNVLGDMESAFELDGDGKDPRAVLQIIFKSIVKNKGDFKINEVKPLIQKCRRDSTQY